MIKLSKLLLACALCLVPMACGNGVLTPKKLFCYVNGVPVLTVDSVSRWRRTDQFLEIELPDGNKMFHILVEGETCLSLYQQATSGETTNGVTNSGDLHARKYYGIRFSGDFARDAQR